MLRTLLGGALIVYGGFALVLYVKQRSFIYFPVPAIEHAYPVEQVRSGEELIEMVVLNGTAEHAVIYFGGNAESVVANARQFADAFPKLAVYLVNYRGYGRSSGKPTEQGLYADARVIFDLLRDRHHGISVIGRSLGTGVATYLAANRPVEKLILVTPFDSILSIAKDQFPFFPVSLALKDHYDSHGRVKKIDAPTLILVAEHDGIVSAKYSDRLINAFPAGQARVEVLKGAGHNGLSMHDDYMPLMADFLDSSGKG